MSPCNRMNKKKSSDNVTHTAVQPADSLNVTMWSFLCNMPKSRNRRKAITTIKITKKRFSVIFLKVIG